MFWAYPILFLFAFPLALILIFISIVRRSGTKDACHGIVITKPHEDRRTLWFVFILAIITYLIWIGVHSVKLF